MFTGETRVLRSRHKIRRVSVQHRGKGLVPTAECLWLRRGSGTQVGRAAAEGSGGFGARELLGLPGPVGGRHAVVLGRDVSCGLCRGGRRRQGPDTAGSAWGCSERDTEESATSAGGCASRQPGAESVFPFIPFKTAGLNRRKDKLARTVGRKVKRENIRMDKHEGNSCFGLWL